MLHRRTQPSTKKSSPSKRHFHGGDYSGSSTDGDRNHTAFAILLTLLAANFVALIVHISYFLPGYDDLFTNHHSNDVENKISWRKAVALLHLTLSSSQTIRYDIVPKILDQSQSYGVVHQLPSIPDRRRMISGRNSIDSNEVVDSQYLVPSDAVRNLTYFLESRTRPDEEDRPLFIYNPMVLPLDGNVLDESILDDLSVGSDPDYNRACYVAVYRVSNFGNCHGPGFGVPETYQNYLGLALLDQGLNIIQDSDVVIDLNKHLYDLSWTPFKHGRRAKKPKQFMQDCQLFATKGNEGDANKKLDRLILLCNEYATPVRLERKIAGEDENTESDNINSDQEIYFNNHYGSGLQLTALERPNMILFAGKNMHYFEASAGSSYNNNTGGINHGPGFLEIWPGGPHETVHIDFASYPYVKHKEELRMMKSAKPEPNAAYLTTDSPKKGGERNLLIDRDSGSACCVSIRWKDENDGQEQHLLMGFSHRKTRKTGPKATHYNYVSRVYAFQKFPPFDIVARSGFFCLGFAKNTSHEALNSDNEQVMGSANDIRLTIRADEFDCPRIHFITGIAEKVGDEEIVIISYGVNDCYPRMIEVSKSFLMGLLRSSQ